MLKRIINTTCSVRSKIDGFVPEAGIVLGSGLGALAEQMEVLYRIPYSGIEGFPLSTVEGHQGALLFGHLGGRKVVVMQGRFHYYEGYTPQEVTFPIRVLKELGIQTLLLSNAAGGLNPGFRVGDIMALDTHINLIPNPLIGPNLSQLGPRFPDMSEPYSLRLIEKAKTVALKLGFTLQRGCYVATTGPSYETAGEIRFFRQIGGDAVGMSTAPEVIVARHMGLDVFAVSVITNLAMADSMQTATHQEVIEAGAQAAKKMSALFIGVLESL